MGFCEADTGLQTSQSVSAPAGRYEAEEDVEEETESVDYSSYALHGFQCTLNTTCQVKPYTTKGETILRAVCRDNSKPAKVEVEYVDDSVAIINTTDTPIIARMIGVSARIFLSTTGSPSTPRSGFPATSTAG